MSAKKGKKMDKNSKLFELGKAQNGKKVFSFFSHFEFEISLNAILPRKEFVRVFFEKARLMLTRRRWLQIYVFSLRSDKNIKEFGWKKNPG